jgi:hypothetical protein
MNNLPQNAGAKRPADSDVGIELPCQLPSEIPGEERTNSNDGITRNRGTLDIPNHISVHDDLSRTDVSSITNNVFPPHYVESTDLQSNTQLGSSRASQTEEASQEFIQQDPSSAPRGQDALHSTETGTCPRHDLRQMEQGIIRKGLISVAGQTAGNSATTQREVTAGIALACVGLPVLQEELISSQGAIRPQIDLYTERAPMTRHNSQYSARGTELSTSEQRLRSSGTSRDQGHNRETEILMDPFEASGPGRNRPHPSIASVVAGPVDNWEPSQPGAFRCGNSTADIEPRNIVEANDVEEQGENMEELPEIVLEATLYDGRELEQDSESGDGSEDVQEDANILVEAELMDAKFVAMNFFLSRQGRIMMLFRLLIFTILFSVTALVLKQQQHKQQNKNTDTVAPGGHSTSPSSLQATSPTSAPTVGFSKASLPYHTQQSIKDKASPQSRAWDWVRADPNFPDLPTDRAIQRFVLATFYEALNGDVWVNNNQWMNYSAHECFDWYSSDHNVDQYGTKCDSEGMVVHLQASLNAMKGTIPPELALLSGSLESLSIPRNNIRGTLPTVGLLWRLWGASSVCHGF